MPFFRIYYAKHFSVPPINKDGGPMKVEELLATHQPVAVIQSVSIQHTFTMMQGEMWSPNGEARELILALGLEHTSMSMGDVAVNEKNEVWVCDFIGWKMYGILEKE